MWDTTIADGRFRRGSPGLSSYRALPAIILAGLLALTTYALTASNTVPTTNAGAGAAAITGYALSGTSYTLDAANPQVVGSVTFTLDAPASASVSTVAAKLASPSPYQSCNLVSSTATTSTWSCPQSVPATQADLLDVAAAQ